MKNWCHFELPDPDYPTRKNFFFENLDLLDNRKVHPYMLIDLLLLSAVDNCGEVPGPIICYAPIPLSHYSAQY
jgi:hypothetical protein